MIKKNTGLILSLLAGAAIGTVLGILYAPEEGKKTRKKLKKKAEDLKNLAINEYHNISHRAKENIDKLSDNVRNKFDS